MKMINLLFVCSIFLIGVCCSKDDTEAKDNKLNGTWIEKNPELYDGIPDTLVFTDDFLVEKHFYFDGYSYEQKNDSIVFFKNSEKKGFSFDFISSNEIVINNFLDRSVTSEVKNIHFQKLN